MSVAFVFPGQGSQQLGMLAALAAEFPVVIETFAEAGAALGEDIWALAQQGPEERLNQTAHTQPILLTAGVAVYRAWQAAGGAVPALLAGHSLGEYTALVVAGAIDFADAVRLTRLRGELMQAAVPAGEGAMAAVLNAELDVVEAVCAEASAVAPVQAANLNSPGQIVISGAAVGVARATELFKARGVKRVLPLPVSVPSHSSLMRGAAEQLSAALAGIAIRTPVIPVIHNVDACPHAEPDAIRRVLAEQLHQPVRWIECVRALAAAGAGTLIECGPGKVLSGLNKRIDPALGGHAIGEPAALREALHAISGATA
ncbi:MAG: ACP S-malonyltransferase [Xanthomonadales bacterium]|jgi:[acyl-carrier-protein] S-malonyltransferase|nr:ACP S-malonyltransferase [Xanthomonadales bacterium]